MQTAGCGIPLDGQQKGLQPFGGNELRPRIGPARHRSHRIGAQPVEHRDFLQCRVTIRCNRR